MTATAFENSLWSTPIKSSTGPSQTRHPDHYPIKPALDDAIFVLQLTAIPDVDDYEENSDRVYEVNV
ncbi:MAG: hypothetical protein ABEI86_13920 [Halobacteriaceae archaeon]